jgi:hypothetical protein
MARSRQMAELRGRHAREIRHLLREFVRQNPTIDIDLDQDNWTAAQNEAWRQFTAKADAKFVHERERLAEELRSHDRVH